MNFSETYTLNVKQSPSDILKLVYKLRIQNNNVSFKSVSDQKIEILVGSRLKTWLFGSDENHSNFPMKIAINLQETNQGTKLIIRFEDNLFFLSSRKGIKKEKSFTKEFTKKWPFINATEVWMETLNALLNPSKSTCEKCNKELSFEARYCSKCLVTVEFENLDEDNQTKIPTCSFCKTKGDFIFSFDSNQKMAFFCNICGNKMT